ncbi:hypothetical protein BDA96_10G115000 [Sorghum bicolor]|uniref:Uncharacterized protein n=2 Tax=Sorghum bicolor TaxID=4558 RepID=A0A921U0E5_SORBI|nr:hypothetical protein BDA96_10G115000 [Sorghum bicolor]KXG19652.1 hypothetical protein SORBI_3010G094200 [Sorghum bicolor]
MFLMLPTNAAYFLPIVQVAGYLKGSFLVYWTVDIFCILPYGKNWWTAKKQRKLHLLCSWFIRHGDFLGESLMLMLM